MNNKDSDNKYKHWVFTIQSVEGTKLPSTKIVEECMKVESSRYLYQLERATSEHYQGCLETKIRVRHATLLNRLAKGMSVRKSCITLSKMEGSWSQAIAYCSKEETRVSAPVTSEIVYSGEDIAVLDDSTRRYPWQNSIIKQIFDEDTGIIKTPDDRAILWIEDPKGGNGKSKFVKWLCARNRDITKISFGTSNQLRSAIISAGRRRVYFIDVPRTLGTEDSIQSLMACCEELKGGFVVSAFYGKNQELMLDPPHIIMFSNSACPKQFLSEDRWETYMITDKKTLLSLSNIGGPWTTIQQ